jgi:hypothetical protein
VIKHQSSSPSRLLPEKKSAQQEIFERDAREKLENADMEAFDRMMKDLLRRTPKGDSHAR